MRFRASITSGSLEGSWFLESLSTVPRLLIRPANGGAFVVLA